MTMTMTLLPLLLLLLPIARPSQLVSQKARTIATAPKLRRLRQTLLLALWQQLLATTPAPAACKVRR